MLKLLLQNDAPGVWKAAGLKISYVAQDTSGLKGKISDYAYIPYHAGKTG